MKVFIEEQKFTQWWLMILIVGLSLIGPIAIVLDWDAIKSDEIGGIIVIVLAAFMPIFLLMMFLSLKLKTRIDEYGIHYQFFPVHFSYKSILWSAIENCELRKFNAIKEYGGWGIKHSFKKKTGKSYTVKGNVGLQIILKTGKKILIGTQERYKIEHLLKNYNHNLLNHEL